jgi:hypothetical protein
MSWRDKIARFLGLGRRTRLDAAKTSPSLDIDPIEELAHIINEAQERDTRDEGRFDDLARLDPPKPIRAATQPRRRVRRS